MTTTYLGTDGTTERLVTIHDNGTAEVAERPHFSGASWSAPATLQLLDAGDGRCRCGMALCSDKAVAS